MKLYKQMFPPLRFAIMSLIPLVNTACTSRGAAIEKPETRRLSVDKYRDKMMAGWVGQMTAVGWGYPTEFRWKGQIIPEDRVPKWNPEMVNDGFKQDDLYVEMTFLRTLEEQGWDVSIRQAGIDFARTKYRLWHANESGRNNLRAGIAPPDSGHPEFNHHADDIDYQIEADYAGLICPGMPALTNELGEKFGRLMNYGDGLYGGQFVSGMYAEAFFEDDMVKIIEAGLACIPAESQYAECIRDTVRWWKERPSDWTRTWDKIEAKYNDNPDYRRFSCTTEISIDAKLNGAYIVVGLLYGQMDMDRTIIISMRCGQDSDCNPANAAGILGVVLGYEAIPDRLKSALKTDVEFSHTPYTFPELLSVCEELTRQAVLRNGGSIEQDAAGGEVLIIPKRGPQVSELDQSWEPAPPIGSRFTEEELQQMMR